MCGTASSSVTPLIAFLHSSRRGKDGRHAHDLVSKSFLQLAISEDMASRPYANLNVLSKRRMNSATDSASFWAVCRKSCAAKARPPGSRWLRREVTAWSYVFLSSSSNKLHSCSARPLRWPANCNNNSSGVQPFHCEARLTDYKPNTYDVMIN